MNLTQIAFFLFVAVAAGGLLMAGMIVGNIKIPGFLGPAHGLAGLAALVVLLTANMKGAATPDRAWWAFGVFLAGFSGGLLLFRVLFKDRTPLFLVAGHGSIAVVGLYLLYGVAF